MSEKVLSQKSKIPVIASIGVIVTEGNKVLLVRAEEESGHINGMYGLPSGRIDEGETEEEAAVRELAEETGLICSTENLTQFPENYFQADIPRADGTIRRFSWRVLKANIVTGNLRPTPETTPEFVGASRLLQLERERRLLPNTIKAIRNTAKNTL